MLTTIFSEFVFQPVIGKPNCVFDVNYNVFNPIPDLAEENSYLDQVNLE